MTTTCYTGCTPPPIATSPPMPPPATPPPVHLIQHTASVGQLAFTGADVLQLVVLAAALIVVGLFLVRRRAAR